MHELHAFVNIFVDPSLIEDVIDSLSRIDEVEELYEITGEFDLVALVSASDIKSFREVLKNKIMKIKGVKSTVTLIVLSTHKGPKCTT